ncbi:MAG: thioredoxin family protein [Chitinophagales bacterium]
MTTEVESRSITSEELRDHWNHSLPYNLYRDLIEELSVLGRTTGFEQTDEKVSNMKLNIYRMNRVEKTFTLNSHLSNEILLQPRPLKWLVITEGWCGDSAQILPALEKIAEASNGRIEMKTILRDENPELMNAFLTSGTRSVPKLICMDDSFHVLATWGPRPEYARKLVINLKSNPQTAPIFKEELHKWYAKDRSQTVEEEIAQMLMLVRGMQVAIN